MKKAVFFMTCMCTILLNMIFIRAEGYITRIESLKLIMDCVGYDENAIEAQKNCPFEDVLSEDKIYVGYAYEKAITTGISETEFAPNREVTREEFLCMVLRLLKYDISPGDVTLYQQAEMSGIYPEKQVGSFTEFEAKRILARAIFARVKSTSSNYGIMLRDNNDVIVGQEYSHLTIEDVFTVYQKSIGEISSKIGPILYENDLPDCRIIFAYTNLSTMHATRLYGYVIFKNDGEVEPLELCYKDNKNMSIPDEVHIINDGKELYYIYNCKEDILNPWNNEIILQKAGVYEYHVNLETREIIKVVTEK